MNKQQQTNQSDINEKNVGHYINEKLKSLGWKQTDLAVAMQNLMPENRQNSNLLQNLTDNISKWIKGARFPGVDYIYYLAKALNITMEELLRAGEECEKYDDRPFSLYAIAKSGSISRYEEMMAYLEDKNIAHRYDEFDKTLLDYLIEFKQDHFIDYILKKGDLNFNSIAYLHGSHSSSHLGIEFINIIALAIEKNNLDLFKKLFWRGYPIYNINTWQPNNYEHAYKFTDNMCKNLLSAHKILSFLTTPYTDEQEWKTLNPSIPDTTKQLCKIPRLSKSFNFILQLALDHKRYDIADKMIDIATEHNKCTLSLLSTHYPNTSYLIMNSYGNIQTSRYDMECLTVLGFVKNINDITDNNLKTKALNLNDTIKNIQH